MSEKLRQTEKEMGRNRCGRCEHSTVRNFAEVDCSALGRIVTCQGGYTEETSKCEYFKGILTGAELRNRIRELEARLTEAEGARDAAGMVVWRTLDKWQKAGMSSDEIVAKLKEWAISTPTADARKRGENGTV